MDRPGRVASNSVIGQDGRCADTLVGVSTIDLQVLAKRVSDAIVDECGDVIRERLNPSDPPPTLYHFTDAIGLLGIMASGTLWATLATSLNDCSEIRYGAELAVQIIKERIRAESVGVAIPRVPSGLRECFLKSTLHYLERPGETPGIFRLEMPSFIVSLCENINKSAHWLHYGKDGSGVAVGLRTNALLSPFDLVRVDYVLDSQATRIEKVLARAFAILKTHCDDAGVTTSAMEMVGNLAGHVTSVHLRVLAVEFKNPVFAEEEEYRLVTRQVHKNALRLGVPPTTKYRVVRGRVVAYEELELGHLRPFPVERIVLGYSCPMVSEDPALIMLAAERGVGRNELVRLTVPVR